jgi:hypothetical protein
MPLSVGVDLSNGACHTFIAEVPSSILFEVKSDPFNPEQAKELAAWAPAESTSEATEYLMFLKEQWTSLISLDI